MSGEILFVLHGPADEPYAQALAAELGGMTLPLQSQASSLQFGSGVVCVVVWSAALRGSDALAALPVNSIICRLNGAATPRALDAFNSIHSTGSPPDDAAELGNMVTALRAAADQCGVRASKAGPQLGAATDAVRRKPPLAVRSAYGMAATLAVAGFVAPTIMERAQANGPETASAAEPTGAPVNGADFRRAALLAIAEQANAAPEAAAPAPVALSSTPAFDLWLSESDQTEVSETEAVVEIVAIAFQPSPEPEAEIRAPEAIIDPKREAFALQAMEDEKAPSNTAVSVASAKNGATMAGAAALH